MANENLLACLERAIELGGRVDLDVGKAGFGKDGDIEYVQAFSVSGCGLGGGYHRTFIDALESWVNSLIKLSTLDPVYYAKYAELEGVLNGETTSG